MSVKQEKSDLNLGYVEEFAIFEQPVIEAGSVKTKWVAYQPKSQLNHAAAIDFEIPGSGQMYIDLSRSYMTVGVRTLQHDGTHLPPIPTKLAHPEDPTKMLYNSTKDNERYINYLKDKSQQYDKDIQMLKQDVNEIQTDVDNNDRNLHNLTTKVNEIEKEIQNIKDGNEADDEEEDDEEEEEENKEKPSRLRHKRKAEEFREPINNDQPPKRVNLNDAPDTPPDTPPTPESPLILGDFPPEGANVGPVQNYFHSLFQQVDISMNGLLITSTNTLYPYKAYIDTMMNHDSLTLDTKGINQLYIKDDPIDQKYNVDPYLGGNNGLRKRALFIKDSKIVEMTSPLFSEIFQLKKYLLNGIALKITLYPSKPEFHLLCPHPKSRGFQTEFVYATMHICHILPSAHMAIGHDQILKKGIPARYPYYRSELRRYSIGKGNYNFQVIYMK